MGKDYTGVALLYETWLASLPPASEFRFPKSGFRSPERIGNSQARALRAGRHERAGESDGEELMGSGFICGLRGLAKERRIWACNYLL